MARVLCSNRNWCLETLVRVKSLHVAEELSTRTSTSTSSATSASTRLLPSFSSSSSLNATTVPAVLSSSSAGFVSGLWGALTGAQQPGSAGVTRQELSPPAPGSEQQYLSALELVPNSSSRGGTTANADGGTTASTAGGAGATDASESEIETAKLRAALAVSALFKRGLLAADAQPLLLLPTSSSVNSSSSIVEDDSAKHTSAAAALSLQ
eukprot:8934-Heterococcus_DN1.PRE.1